MKKRIINIDIMRSIAILLVIYVHCINAIYYYPTSSGSIASQIFKSISFYAGRLGVPLFLFITGALILMKKFETYEDIKRFYINNLLPLFISFIIINIIYYIILIICDHVQFSIIAFLKYILFIEQININNMWYIPMIIGIYIALPFISIIVKKFNYKEVKLVLITLVIYRFLIYSINPFLISFGQQSLDKIIDINFLGSCFGLYVILGYYLYHERYNLVFWNPICIMHDIILITISNSQYYLFRFKLSSLL